jgi:hypothetical protein
VLPQPKQSCTVPSDDSHPSGFEPLERQSLQRPEQVYAQTPTALHVAVLAWVRSHALPQPPQLVVVVKGDSHPSAFGPHVVQSPKPVLQAYEHRNVSPLATHVPDDALFGVHADPHAPQLVVVLRCVSQPFVFGAAESQSPHPGLQPL